MTTTAHIINHTHWDREWFLTSIYTNQWIPGLINKIKELVDQNPDFRYLLDGQTLVIEDLLKTSPGYKPSVEKLVKSGNLIIGPYYCQPDWRLTGGESLIRNLLYGWSDMQLYGGKNDTGWLVDTFGHISQSPQIHHLFGLEAVFVWRGVPRLEPYFQWQGADGKKLFTIDLFGGYRNLYGITHVPEVAIQRLEAETIKLRPFYPTKDVPLFDGYDLEPDPEDPVRFYQQHASAISNDIRVEETSPQDYARELRSKLHSPPVIVGELNSGKFGATYPGTLSARTYLKIMNWDCEHLLYRLCEPLAVLARLKGRSYNARQYEIWGRLLLQNTVHDCICGVSIDLVHEKMEFNYYKIFQAAQQDVVESLAYILEDFIQGIYAISTNAFAYEGWHAVDNKLYPVRTNGIGVWKIKQPELLELSNVLENTFEWRNEHYSVTVTQDGVVRIGEAKLGYLVVTKECGDTYSNEAGNRREVCRPTGPLIIEKRNANYCVLRFECSLVWEEIKISTTVRMTFDPTPLLRWKVDLDSQGSNFQVAIVFETAQPGEIYAGMPFDVVKRPAADRDLMNRSLEEGMASVLLGQRELNEVKQFPFQEFVTISDGITSSVVFARGIHAYQAEEDGSISLILRRAVEWLTKTDLENRVGDAGPVMYVPDARCERSVKHEIAVMIGETTINDMVIHQMNAGFQNPPLIVESHAAGRQSNWKVLQENLPLSSLHIYDQKILARFNNPTNKKQVFGEAYQKTNVRGSPEVCVREIAAKEITTVQITGTLPVIDSSLANASVTIVIWPEWRVGENNGKPDTQIIEQLKVKIIQLGTQLAQIEHDLKHAMEDDHYHLQHAYYVLKREAYELRLSVLLSESKLTVAERSNFAYLFTFDPGLARLGLELNELRIKRRIFDYVVEALSGH
jgi:hypothetical protein